MTLYKWMLPGMKTPVQGKTWPVAVGEWSPKESPAICESGWHGVEEKNVLAQLPLQIGAELWEIEVKGRRVEVRDKFAVAQMKLVRLVGTVTEQNLRLFACDIAEDVLDLFEKKYPGDDRPRTAIEVARRFANGDASREELEAAEAAAEAAWAAAEAAEAAAAAWAAAGAAAGAAARDRYSNWLVVRLESGY